MKFDYSTIVSDVRRLIEASEKKCIGCVKLYTLYGSGSEKEWTDNLKEYFRSLSGFKIGRGKGGTITFSDENKIIVPAITSPEFNSSESEKEEELDKQPEESQTDSEVLEEDVSQIKARKFFPVEVAEATAKIQENLHLAAIKGQAHALLKSTAEKDNSFSEITTHRIYIGQYEYFISDTTKNVVAGILKSFSTQKEEIEEVNTSFGEKFYIDKHGLKYIHNVLCFFGGCLLK